MTTKTDSNEVENRTVVLTGTATVGIVESQIDKAFASGGPSENTLIIDMRDVTFIDLAAMMALSALISSRDSRGQKTRLRIPRSPDVLDFMLTWEFPKAIESVAGLRFDQLLSEQDRGELDIHRQRGLQKYAGAIFDENIGRLLSTRFFALYAFQLAHLTSTERLVTDESKRWQETLVRSVLDRHLKRGPSGYIGSHVVFESLTNALRHPAAKVILTGSQLTGSGSGSFTVAFWDDGTSMIETLRNALIEGRVIDSGAGKSFERKYLYTLEAPDGSTSPARLVSSRDIPDAPDPRDILFLATTFPGVTCDAKGATHTVHPDVAQQPTLNQPGMGLFILINTVVDIYGGSVVFRSDDFYMSIKAPGKKQADDGANYLVKVKQYRASTPKFRGNMLTVRIPTAPGEIR